MLERILARLNSAFNATVGPWLLGALMRWFDRTFSVVANKMGVSLPTAMQTLAAQVESEAQSAERRAVCGRFLAQFGDRLGERELAMLVLMWRTPGTPGRMVERVEGWN